MAAITEPYSFNMLVEGFLKVLSYLEVNGYLDLKGNELRNVVFQNLTTGSLPVNPPAGTPVFNTSLGHFGYWSGSAWVYPSMVSDETIQDAIGSALLDTSSIAWTYDDAGNKISANVRINGSALRIVAGGLDMTPTGITAGTYTKVQVDNYGRVTATFNLTADDLPTLDAIRAPVAAVSLNNQKLTNMADGSANNDGVNVGQLNARIADAKAGVDRKESVRVACRTNINIAAPGATLSGTAMVLNDRVGLPGQTDKKQNGIWLWKGASVPMVRADDADTSAKVTTGMTFFSEEGADNEKNRDYRLITPGPITLGTTELTFTSTAVMDYSIGDGLELVGTTIKAKPDGTTTELVNGNIAVTEAAKAKRYSGTFTGNGTASSVTVTHNLNSLVVNAQVIETATGIRCHPGLVCNTVNQCTLEYVTAPANGKAYAILITA